MHGIGCWGLVGQGEVGVELKSLGLGQKTHWQSMQKALPPSSAWQALQERVGLYKSPTGEDLGHVPPRSDPQWIWVGYSTAGEP